MLCEIKIYHRKSCTSSSLRCKSGVITIVKQNYSLYVCFLRSIRLRKKRNKR